MLGTIFQRKDCNPPFFVVRWPWQGKRHNVNYRNGKKMYIRDHAVMLLGEMRSEVDRGTFSLDKFLRSSGNVTVFLQDWIEQCQHNWGKGTLMGYNSMIRVHLNPFFEKNPILLHEIKPHHIQKLRAEIRKPRTDKEGNPLKPITPKGEKNIVDCLGAALRYAYDNELIDRMPKMPTTDDYGIQDPGPKFITLDRQRKVIEAIPAQHRPIYYWLAYHMRRPSEGMVLKLVDWQEDRLSFLIRRGMSGGVEVEHTKTKDIFECPCRDEFLPILRNLTTAYPLSPYVFTCRESRHKDKRYTKEILNRLWNEARDSVGETVELYEGTKHSTMQSYLDDGYDYTQVMEISGHKTLKAVQRYAHSRLERKRDLLNRKVVELRNSHGTVKAP